MSKLNWKGRCWAGLLSFGLLACSGDVSEAQDHLELWESQNITSYVYIVKVSCFCPLIEPIRVVVTNDVVTSALSIDTDMPYANPSTMTELLEQAVRWAGEADHFEAGYDETLGYLRSMNVDFDSSVEDDEADYDVSCFGVGTGDDVCPASG